MKIFVATSYSSEVDYSTGRVNPESREFLETQLAILEEGLGHTAFNALRYDNWQINDDSAAAYLLDRQELDNSDALIALMGGGTEVSAGVQTEIGLAVALGKLVLLAYPPDAKRGYFNLGMAKTGAVTEIALPLDPDELKEKLVV